MTENEIFKMNVTANLAHGPLVVQGFLLRPKLDFLHQAIDFTGKLHSLKTV